MSGTTLDAFHIWYHLLTNSTTICEISTISPFYWLEIEVQKDKLPKAIT